VNGLYGSGNYANNERTSISNAILSYFSTCSTFYQRTTQKDYKDAVFQAHCAHFAWIGRLV